MKLHDVESRLLVEKTVDTHWEKLVHEVIKSFLALSILASEGLVFYDLLK